MTTLSILLSATPFWYWLTIVAVVATITLIGAAIEYLRYRKRAARASVPVKAYKR